MFVYSYFDHNRSNFWGSYSLEKIQKLALEQIESYIYDKKKYNYQNILELLHKSLNNNNVEESIKLWDNLSLLEFKDRPLYHAIDKMDFISSESETDNFLASPLNPIAGDLFLEGQDIFVNAPFIIQAQPARGRLIENHNPIPIPRLDLARDLNLIPIPQVINDEHLPDYIEEDDDEPF